MEIILSHDHMDFDALASMVAASRIYPHAAMVLSNQQSEQVQEYLAIYRDSFPFISEKNILWNEVDHIILTDAAELDRTIAASFTRNDVPVTVFDHHPLAEENKCENTTYHIDNTGASVTILLEEIMKRELELSEFEATLYALGLYTDTGSFTYPHTTIRDLKAGVFLMEHGMRLELVQQFSEETLSSQQQAAFQHFLSSAENLEEDGLHLVVASLSADDYIGSLNVITSHLLETTGADAAVTVTNMQNKVFIIGRSSSARVDLLPLMQTFNGGGHKRAASASIKDSPFPQVLTEVKEILVDSVTSPLTATSIMTTPVKTITQDTRIDEAKNQLLHYGHNGFPVVNENSDLIGIISRRDIDKATRHGFGHAPVKGYMSTEPITISKQASFEDIQQLLIHHNIGRLPVLENNKMIGIVSRTDVIEQMHKQSSHDKSDPINIKNEMQSLLPPATINLLKQLGELAEKHHTKAYIIGGIVRDLILKTANEDIDIVIEGDGIALAETFASETGAEITRHETFGTATLTPKTGPKLDFTTSRTEYYEKPAALPKVSRSNIKEDVFRRDFTINAIAASLQPHTFGDLLDYFHGFQDIKNHRLRVLHNLSFVEDPTRILRGVRFESRYSFQMDKETEAFIHHSISAISALSHTRIVTEFNYLFTETDPLQSIDRLHTLRVLDKFFQGVVWDKKTRTILTSLLQQQSERSSSLFNNFSKQWFWVVICLYLKNKHTIKYAESIAVTKKQKKVVRDIAYLFEHDTSSLFASAGAFHKYAFFLEEESLFLAALAYEADDSDQHHKAELIHYYYQKRNYLPHWVSGNDLIEAGLSPGPAFKEYLFELEQAVLDGEISRRDDALNFINHRIHDK
ncbi:CBS domain-containing protein [Salibacterium salarium]|uniref:CBS domain-containing protein n=1 Tax=Salibacterium salarium TaxID=284579 RepID=A0A3R9WPV8_9BACI|nr:CBS domain-containing protein [Salibacterium salarium]RSL31027.1 CBS domain-containing protein [Salibacterium salarium]